MASKIKIVVIDLEVVGEVPPGMWDTISALINGTPAPADPLVSPGPDKRAAVQNFVELRPIHSIDRLGLGKRVVGSLHAGWRRNGVNIPIRTVGDLVGLTAAQVDTCPNLGEAGIAEIRSALLRHGLRLAGET